MQHSRRAKIMGECHANLALAELVAEQLGVQACSDHCQNIIECVKELKKKTNVTLAVIDYEKDLAAQKLVDKYIERSNCMCTNWNKGVRLCECTTGETKRLIILLERGVEETLEKLGYRLDPETKARLKSDKVLEDTRNRQGRTYEMLKNLAQHATQLRRHIR